MFTAILNQDYVTAMRLSPPLAEHGDVEAQIWLGELYRDGHGVRQDYAQAAKWFRAAADQGNAEAKEKLGDLYACGGIGLPQNYAEAAKWFLKAAEQGNGDAQLDLGMAYADGVGVSRDLVLAHMWLNLAASNDSVDYILAKFYRDEVAKQMTPSEIADAQSLAANWKPEK